MDLNSVILFYLCGDKEKSVVILIDIDLQWKSAVVVLLFVVGY